MMRRRSEAFGVPILDMAELLEEIGSDWGMPKGKRWGYKGEKAERIARGWIDYLEKTLRGFKIVRETATKGQITLDFPALDACNDLEKALPAFDFEEREAKVKAALRAFKSLLDSKVRPEEDDKEAAGMIVKSYESALAARMGL